MGCHSYTVWGRREAWKEYILLFSEGDDDLPCLCTFPHNDEIGGELAKDTIISLALLGASVVLAHQGHFEDEYNYIPYCLPDWIVEQIKQKFLAPD